MAKVTKRTGELLIAIALTLRSASVWAADPSYCSGVACDCVGTIKQLLVYRDGAVLIKGSWHGSNDGFTKLCNTNEGAPVAGLTGAYKTPAATNLHCAQWVAMARDAQRDQLLVHVYYRTNLPSCAVLPTYDASLAPEYFALWD